MSIDVLGSMAFQPVKNDMLGNIKVRNIIARALAFQAGHEGNRNANYKLD